MHRVIIVGCGFAGLFAANALRRAEVEVVVVDRTNHHLSRRCSTRSPRECSPKATSPLRSATCCVTTATRGSCSARSSTSTSSGAR